MTVWGVLTQSFDGVSTLDQWYSVEFRYRKIDFKDFGLSLLEVIVGYVRVGRFSKPAERNRTMDCLCFTAVVALWCSALNRFIPSEHRIHSKPQVST